MPCVHPTETSDERRATSESMHELVGGIGYVVRKSLSRSHLVVEDGSGEGDVKLECLLLE
jgi:hypothetical protein